MGRRGAHLRLQEYVAVLQEQLWILVVRRVPGVGIDDQLRVRYVLRHDPRVDRRDHDVVGTVHYEGRLLNRLQFGKALALDLTPLEDRRVLSLCGLLRRRRVQVEAALASLLPTRLLPFPKGVPGGLARIRR